MPLDRNNGTLWTLGAAGLLAVAGAVARRRRGSRDLGTAMLEIRAIPRQRIDAVPGSPAMDRRCVQEEQGSQQGQR